MKKLPYLDDDIIGLGRGILAMLFVFAVTAFIVVFLLW